MPLAAYAHDYSLGKAVGRLRVASGPGRPPNNSRETGSVIWSGLHTRLTARLLTLHNHGLHAARLSRRHLHAAGRKARRQAEGAQKERVGNRQCAGRPAALLSSGDAARPRQASAPSQRC